MPKQYTLGKNERLKSRKRIELLFSSGRKITVPPYRVFYALHSMQSETDEPLQAGFAAGSRHFRTAVGRNRVKRITREAYRLQKNALKDFLKEKQTGMDLFFIYTGKDQPEFQQVHESMGKIINTLIATLNRKN